MTLTCVNLALKVYLLPLAVLAGSEVDCWHVPPQVALANAFHVAHQVRVHLCQPLVPQQYRVIVVLYNIGGGGGGGRKSNIIIITLSYTRERVSREGVSHGMVLKPKVRTHTHTHTHTTCMHIHTEYQCRFWEANKHLQYVWHA